MIESDFNLARWIISDEVKEVNQTISSTQAGIKYWYYRRNEAKAELDALIKQFNEVYNRFDNARTCLSMAQEQYRNLSAQRDTLQAMIKTLDEDVYPTVQH